MNRRPCRHETHGGRSKEEDPCRPLPSSCEERPELQFGGSNVVSSQKVSHWVENLEHLTLVLICVDRKRLNLGWWLNRLKVTQVLAVICSATSPRSKVQKKARPSVGFRC